jgi:hypothetical protein
VLFNILDEQDLFQSMEYFHIIDSRCYGTFNVLYGNAVKFVVPSTLNCNVLIYNLDPRVVSHIEIIENCIKIKIWTMSFKEKLYYFLMI